MVGYGVGNRWPLDVASVMPCLNGSNPFGLEESW